MHRVTPRVLHEPSGRRAVSWVLTATTLGMGGVVAAKCVIRAPVTGRAQVMLSSDEELRELGEESARALLSEEGFAGAVLPASHPDVVLLTNIAARVVAAAEPFLDGRQFEWKLYVVDDITQTNAFVVGDGSIFVFTGLLHMLGRDVHAVAFVLGHEIAHTLARHIGERIFAGLAILAIDAILTVTTALFTELSALAFTIDRMRGEILAEALHAPFSRRMEREADAIGLHLATAACFDPQGAVRAWERFQWFERLSEDEREHFLQTAQGWTMHSPATTREPGPAARPGAVDPRTSAGTGARSTDAGTEEGQSSLFSSHPSHAERRDTMARMQARAVEERPTSAADCDRIMQAWWADVEATAGVDRRRFGGLLDACFSLFGTAKPPTRTGTT